MSNNKYVQALIIAGAGTVLSFIPVAGGCLSCIGIIGLFLYFSKGHAAEDSDYGIGAGIKFGMVYAMVSTGLSLVLSVIAGDFMRNMVLAEMEKSAAEAGQGMDFIIEFLTDISHGEIILYFTLFSAIMSVLYGLILGLVSGLIFSKDDEE